MTLERVVYESRATGRTDSLMNMATILAESQRNNARDGLTGALAAHEGRFIQVLEGAAVDIDRLMRRLDNDPRHREVTILDRRTIESRSFGAWTMANARFRADQTQALEAVLASRSPEATVAMLKAAVIAV